MMSDFPEKTWTFTTSVGSNMVPPRDPSDDDDDDEENNEREDEQEEPAVVREPDE